VNTKRFWVKSSKKKETQPTTSASKKLGRGVKYRGSRRCKPFKIGRGEKKKENGGGNGP